jgi:hypothetical protein
VGAPLFAVAGLTIDIAVGSVASDDGVKGLGAVLALETFTMPRSSLGEDLFGGEDYAAATGTTLAGWSLDARGVDNRGLGGGVTKSPSTVRSRRIRSGVLLGGERESGVRRVTEVRQYS